MCKWLVVRTTPDVPRIKMFGGGGVGKKLPKACETKDVKQVTIKSNNYPFLLHPFQGILSLKIKWYEI